MIDAIDQQRQRSREREAETVGREKRQKRHRGRERCGDCEDVAEKPVDLPTVTEKQKHIDRKRTAETVPWYSRDTERERSRNTESAKMHTDQPVLWRNVALPSPPTRPPPPLPRYYLERACMNQVLALSTGLPLREIRPEICAEVRDQELADLEEYGGLHFAAHKRILAHSLPGCRMDAGGVAGMTTSGTTSTSTGDPPAARL